MANSLLTTTTPTPLFLGTILACMRTTAPFRWHSSLLPGFSAGDTLLGPLNGSSSSIAAAHINMNKLFNALRANNALSFKMKASLAIFFPNPHTLLLLMIPLSSHVVFSSFPSWKLLKNMKEERRRRRRRRRKEKWRRDLGCYENIQKELQMIKIAYIKQDDEQIIMQ